MQPQVNRDVIAVGVVACYYITQAAAMQVLEDYMGWVAIVHQRLRGWTQC